jgi:hypothetical protein
MPHIHKSKNNSRNSSRKSTASSQGTPVVQVEDEGFVSILAKIKPISSKKSTPKMKTPEPRPEFLEPLSPAPISPPPPPPTAWELLGMTEEDFNAMQERVHKQYREDMRKTLIDNLIAELDSPSYWNRRIERLEKEREYFNKKRGWSALDIACVDQIDADIQECEDEIERIYSEMDRLEYEYD